MSLKIPGLSLKGSVQSSQSFQNFNCVFNDHVLNEGHRMNLKNRVSSTSSMTEKFAHSSQFRFEGLSSYLNSIIIDF